MIQQQVQYDQKPTLCTSCKKYGHEVTVCRMNNSGTKAIKDQRKGTKLVEANAGKPHITTKVGDKSI